MRDSPGERLLEGPQGGWYARRRMESGTFFHSETAATLKEVRPYDVHGARFVEIGFSFSGDPSTSVRRARISDNLIYANPRPGDRVRVEVLMGNVSRVSLLDS